MNPMQEIRIEKVTVNLGCGGDLQKIERAQKLLEKLTGQKPIVTKSRRRSTFGIARGKPVGVKVTLRKEKALNFLKLVLQAVGMKLKASQFDEQGNLNIGIKEYIDLPGVKYSHEIGMLGFDVAVTLERPGFRIKRRRIKKRKIPNKVRIKKEEAMNWFKEKFGVSIVE
jgi:large subunit ribosomal protein L5